MREIKFKVFNNKKIINLNGDNLVGRKGENNTTVLKFLVDPNLVEYNNYIVLTSPSNINYLIDLDNFRYEVKQWVNNEVGTWQMEYVSTSQEINSVEEIDENQAILISNAIDLRIEDSNASKELHLEPTPDVVSMETRIEQKVDGLVETTDGLVSSVDAMESDINTLINQGVVCDLTPVLDELDGVESDLAKINGKLDNIEVDLTPVENKLDGIEDKIDLIPTNDYTNDLTSIENKVDNIPTNDYTSTLSSISGKIDAIPTTDYTNSLNGIDGKCTTISGKCDDILTAIQNIGPGATGNATAADVLKNKTFSNSQGSGLIGTMTNNGAVSKVIRTKGQAVTVPQGYHNGNGTVSIVSSEQDKIIAENIKSGVTILGVEGTYQGQSATGDATAADVLSGKTFSNANGVGLNGSMTNVGAQTIQITSKAQQAVITQGYHNGNGRAMIDPMSMNNIVAGNIKDGVTILGVTGNYTGGSSFKLKRLAGLFAGGDTGHSNLEIFDDIISSCDSPTDTSLDDFCSNMNVVNVSDNQLNNYKFSTILQTVPFSSMTSFINAFYDQGLDIGYLQETIDLSSALVTSNMFQNFGVDKKTYPNPTPSQSYLELDFNNTGDNVYDARYMFCNANIKSIKNINCFYRTPDQAWAVSDPHYFGGVSSWNSDYCYIEELTFGDKPLFDAPWSDSDAGATLYDMTLDLSACSNFTANSIQDTLSSLVAKTQSNVVNIKLAHSLYVGLPQGLIDSVTSKGYTLVDANPT